MVLELYVAVRQLDKMSPKWVSGGICRHLGGVGVPKLFLFLFIREWKEISEVITASFKVPTSQQDTHTQLSENIFPNHTVFID